MPDYEIRPYGSEDLEEIVGLYGHLIRGERDHCRRLYFRWKYLENPFLQPPIMMLARLGSEVAGMRGTYGSSWRDLRTGRSIVIPHADDLAIHPEHRNRGLFLPLMEALADEAARRGYPRIIGLSGGSTTQRLALATGWAAVGDIDRHARTSLVGDLSRRFRLIRRARGLLRRVRRRRLRSATRLLPTEAEIDAVVDRIASPGGQVSRRSQDFISEIASVADASEPFGEPLMRASRDVRYLRWRLRNPTRIYRILSWDDGGSRGYAVLSWTTPEVTNVHVADSAFTDRDAFEGLVGAICGVKSLEVTLMTARLPRPRLDLLRGLGFTPLAATSLPSERRRFLIVGTSREGTQREEPSGLQSSSLAEWDFDLLESMQV